MVPFDKLGIVEMGISYRFRKNGDFSRKSQNFLILLYFVPPFDRVPSVIGIRVHGSKKLELWGYYIRSKRFKICLAV